MSEDLKHSSNRDNLLCLDEDKLVIDLDPKIEEEPPSLAPYTSTMINELDNLDHGPPSLDLFCREKFVDPAVQTKHIEKPVKVHRVTLEKTADGVQFLVDPPYHRIRLDPNYSHYYPPPTKLTPVPHPIDTDEDQVVELKTSDLDTPIHLYVNERGEMVYEFQIPPVSLIDSPVGGLQRNLASSLVAEGVSTDTSLQPLFRTRPGPPLLLPPDMAVIDSMVDCIHLDGRRAKTWLCKGCGKFFHKKGALLTHVNIHLGFRPFQCKSCFKSFFHRSSLNAHLRNDCISQVIDQPTGLTDTTDEKECD